MASLEQQAALLTPIYGARNQLLMPNLWQRVAFTSAGMHNFVRAYDHRQSNLYASRLASLFARWCSATDWTTYELIVSRLSTKYPVDHCGYCGRPVCKCEPDRPDILLSSPDQVQMAWSIGDWQAGMARVYGPRNEERGLDRAVYKLGDEISEVLTNCLLKSVRPSGYVHSGKTDEKILFELADVFAWMCGVATMLKVDLEQAFITKYERGCPSCPTIPCSCKLPEYVEGSDVAETVFAA